MSPTIPALLRGAMALAACAVSACNLLTGAADLQATVSDDVGGAEASGAGAAVGAGGAGGSSSSGGVGASDASGASGAGVLGAGGDASGVRVCRPNAAGPEGAYDEANMLGTLKSAHPRLLVEAGEIERTRQLIKTDPWAKAAYEALVAHAEAILTSPAIERKVSGGGDILYVSWDAQDHLNTLAGLFLLDADPRWLARAREDMLSVAAFSDWNPSHFLDVSVMTAAVALGYDWLYSELSQADRDTIRAAIVKNGLQPGLDAYAVGGGWTHAKDWNWSHVCAGGLTTGALAVADEEPDVARPLLEKTQATMRYAMETYAPDGGWPEGTGYWAFGTEYNVFHVASMKTALGTDFGLSAMPGFPETAQFRIHTIGTSGKSFNYADSGEGVNGQPRMFWFGREFDRPDYAHFEQMLDKPGGMFGLLWYDPACSSTAGTCLR